ncbi:hypothetical protein HPB48_012711 [Haemaphysalis longicornis]|uniref:Uncharacterized protein n=1 Tax=Haemaphysalis longicornis TaxID=44386 RepID=A0A9J6FZZ6_HAELO|nr:hypothetical protein HPB48_012711 [Haemaphysalis longicornis]
MDGHRVHLGALQEVNLGVFPGRHRNIEAWLRGPRRIEQRLLVEVEVEVAGHDGDAAKVGVDPIRGKHPGRGQPLKAVVQEKRPLRRAKAGFSEPRGQGWASDSGPPEERATGESSLVSGRERRSTEWRDLCPLPRGKTSPCKYFHVNKHSLSTERSSERQKAWGLLR